MPCEGLACFKYAFTGGAFASFGVDVDAGPSGVAGSLDEAAVVEVVPLTEGGEAADDVDAASACAVEGGFGRMPRSFCSIFLIPSAFPLCL